MTLVNKLVIQNLTHRPIRSLLCVFAIALQVTMILTLVGVSEGTLSDAAQRSRRVGADIVIRPPNSSILSFGYSFSAGLLRFVEKQPHIQSAAGILVQPLSGVGNSVNGLDLESFNRLSGGFRLVSGRLFQRDDEVIVDDYYARQHKVRAGDTVDLLNRKWRVSGVVQSGMLSRIIVPLHVLQDLTANSGKVSILYIRLDNPANTKGVMADLKSKLENYPIYSMEDLMAAMTIDNVPMLRPFINLVIGIGVVVGFLVVFQCMYTAVLERTREIGTLKAMGASRSYVLNVLLRESAAMTVAGAILGILFTYGTRFLISKLPSPLIQEIVPGWWPVAFALALFGGLLGALYPGWKAANQDVIDSLSYD
jgi:putative ABC transport system permease protein